jgi:hypothetical protein
VAGAQNRECASRIPQRHGLLARIALRNLAEAPAGLLGAVDLDLMGMPATQPKNTHLLYEM